MVEKIRKRFAFIFLVSAIIFFYVPFLTSLLTSQRVLPIPSDTIVGLYSPYRDFFSLNYPNGIPFKNFLITDPVRQTFVWKELAMDVWKNGSLPLWNPYEMAGKPLLANFQSGAFYPLNFVFFLAPLSVMWSLFILLQSLMSGVFTYLYLRNLKLNTGASALGAAAFSFSGFSMSWLEWGNVGHTALWLPLILYVIDKLFSDVKKISFFFLPKISSSIVWSILFIISLSSSMLAGHLQTFFYVYLIALSYFMLRWVENKRIKKAFLSFLILNVVVLLITSMQWFPTLQFIFSSARGIDQSYLMSDGWFVPFIHLIQFLVPDFFGNPATLNYWGTWNYGELVGYIGILPFLLASYALFNKNSTVIYFSIVGLLALIFALPTGISSLPFSFNIPLLSSAQPTRLMFLISFALAVLSSFGASFIFRPSKFQLKLLIPLIAVGILFLLLWILTLMRVDFLFSEVNDSLVAFRNLILPTSIFIVSVILVLAMVFVRRRVVREVIIVMILLLTFLDLLRFAQKFTPFTYEKYLFPSTKLISFLKNDTDTFRVAVLDRRIMPPNFFTHYRIQTIEGYDPLYLRSYAEYIVASERGKADISKPFGFNRIITPHNYKSELFNFLNTKYILSFDELSDAHVTKVFEEGQTKVYKNNNAYPRAYFVREVVRSENVIEDLFKYNLRETAIIGAEKSISNDRLSVGTIKIDKYSENSVILETDNSGDGFAVLSDSFYPTWEVLVDGKKSQIIETNRAFRGVFVPAGRHIVVFNNKLF